MVSRGKRADPGDPVDIVARSGVQCSIPTRGASGYLVDPAAFKAVEGALLAVPGGFDSHPLPF